MTQEALTLSGKLLKLVRYIYQLIKDGFTGNIQVNFYMGGITNITTTQSHKFSEETTEEKEIKTFKLI